MTRIKDGMKADQTGNHSSVLILFDPAFSPRHPRAIAYFDTVVLGSAATGASSCPSAESSARVR
jgi:hypothetical protein